MKAPPVSVDGTGVLALAAVAVLAYVVWKGAHVVGQAWDSTVQTVKDASAAVSLDTTLPDSAYSDPAAQETAAGALGQSGGDNVISYYWHKLWPSTTDSTGGASGSW